MTLEEANKIIVKYMDSPSYYTHNGEDYFASLDNLVPVWEKMDNLNSTLYWKLQTPRDFCRYAQYLEELMLGEIKTIQEALFIVTAKKIKELNK